MSEDECDEPCGCCACLCALAVVVYIFFQPVIISGVLFLQSLALYLQSLALIVIPIVVVGLVIIGLAALSIIVFQRVTAYSRDTTTRTPAPPQKPEPRRSPVRVLDSPSKEVCAVCGLGFKSTQRVLMTPCCNTQCHYACITEWVKSKGACPHCRTPLRYDRGRLTRR